MYSYLNKETFDAVITSSEIKDKNFIPVDENILPAISMLNKKGYITTDCCEGHYENLLSTSILKQLRQHKEMTYEEWQYPYIAFAEGIVIPDEIEMPFYWRKYTTTMYTNHKPVLETRKCIMRANYLEEFADENNFYFCKCDILKSLFEWVEKL